MKKFWKQLFCDHEWHHHRNIYGDEINFLNARSEWFCPKCGKIAYGKSLFVKK